MDQASYSSPSEPSSLDMSPIPGSPSEPFDPTALDYYSDGWTSPELLLNFLIPQNPNEHKIPVQISPDDRKKKRQEQNRRAQQAFRERRAKVQQELEAQNAELRSHYASLVRRYHAQSNLVTMLKEYIDSLITQLSEARAGTGNNTRSDH